MNTLFLLLQAQGGNGGGSMLIWLILIFVVMWLLMIRPQQKQAKKEREFRDSLKKGDRVSFSGGQRCCRHRREIHGAARPRATRTEKIDKGIDNYCLNA